MIPTCIGIIMDGNRRFARAKNLPTLEGHKQGYEKLKEVSSWARKAGVKFLIVYAFSTENWNRSKEEVSYLLDLFKTVLQNEIEHIAGEGARIRFLGERERFSADIRNMMHEAEEKTKDNDAFTLGIALSYGGRAEILSAVKELRSNEEEITEEIFAKHLWTAEMPDPDVIIRTGGEKRLSNFLPWQSVYSELFFSDTLWPDFSKEEFKNILTEFGERDRRRGR